MSDTMAPILPAHPDEFEVEICPNCTAHYTPDPAVGDGRPKCPVCETRRQCERLMGQFMTLLKAKKDKRPPGRQKRIIIPGRTH